MRTWCERQGQIEVGVMEHEGHTFAALGASVQGRTVTGYQKTKNGEVTLTTWCGESMLACRSEVVEQYHDGALVLIVRLRKGRFGTIKGVRNLCLRSDTFCRLGTGP